MARKKSILTEKQSNFVEALLDGKTQSAAAAEAGYANASGGAVAEHSANVQHALREARSELSSAAQVKRADLVEVLVDAIEMARMMADPMGMIAGAREVGKMLGLYAPEEKKIDLTINQERLLRQYEELSDDDLLRVIEGEHVRLDS
jgi:phage terminase small subunit